MWNRLLLVLLCSLSVISDSFADEVKRLAVLEFRGVDIDQSVLLKLSDQSRTAAVEVLDKEQYLIMTRENMMEVLSDMGLDASCMEGQCEVEIGRNIQADIIVTGDILKLEGTYVLTLKLYDTLSGGLLQSVDVEDTSLLSLKKKTFTQSKVLFQKGLGLSGGSSDAVNIQSGFTGTVENDDWDVSSGNTAIVEFSSSPSGAVVLVDGQLLCTETPCSKEIKAGSHTVVFQKERYFPYQSTINAKTGVKISGDLEARFGHVSVSSSSSGVKVLMDGERFGSTPISRTEVDAGVHTLSIDDPCYVGQDYRFQMKPGDEEDVTYPVTERQSAIKVTVTDKENVLLGDVYVDGRSVGQSSSVIKVPLCSKEVKVKVNDRTFTEKLTLQERQISEISVDASGLGPVVTGVDYTAKLIPAGTFTMGCTSEQSDCDDDEKPTHKVTLTKDFYMMESEVTQGLYRRVLGASPSEFSGENRPVEKVSWFDAVKFANKLSEMEGLEQCYSINGNTVKWSNPQCTGWRLPTEAEWEYSARGGESYKYAGSNSVGDVAWYRENSSINGDRQTHDVCGKNRNGYGLCDMSGNVWEWVWDYWKGTYSSSPTVDPRGPDSGSYRVFRGGSWINYAQIGRVSRRGGNGPADTYDNLGFRLCRLSQKERYFPYQSTINANTGAKISGDLEARFGHVSVSSSPSGVKVLMDGERFGSTPISRTEVDAGVHTLSIDDPCYVGQDYRFQMKPGGEEDVTYPVTERQSAIKVMVTDKENVLLGDVYVDGRNVGQSSRVIKVPLCSKEVKVKVNDRTFTEKLTLQERQISEIGVDASGPGPVVKGVDYTAKLIPAGTFRMGCTSEQGDDCYYSEKPAHKVTISKDFYMMESEVTQRLYQRVMGSNPSLVQGLNRPVEDVSWFDAVKFANKLSSMEGLEQCYSIKGKTVRWSNPECTGWRLPTEAEWEYAARGGQSYKYAGSNSVGDVAWYDGNSGEKTHNVCGKNRNGYGLCDMSGNVYEWVWDRYGDYSSSPTVDPRGPDSGSSRVNRGGSWGSVARYVRVSDRLYDGPARSYSVLGFRLCRLSP